MDISDFDLNLLLVFEALMKHRSVTIAGRHLGLSQPAMSYMLAKMRKVLGDTLFVRVRTGVEPTPRALSIVEPIRAVLEKIRSDVLSTSGFDCRTSSRLFTLCTSDVGEAFFLSRIVREMRSLAPRLSLRSRSLTPAALEEGLDSGEIDLAVGYFPDLKRADIFQQALFTSHFVCIARRGNPFVKGPFTMQRFLDAPYVDVATPGRSREVIQRYLAKKDIRRNVQLQISHFLSLGEILPQSDLLAIVPREAGQFFARQGGRISAHTLPFKSPTFRLAQHWHKRNHDDLGSRWLREIIRSTFQVEPSAG
jgi:DNA-binding transcriptional LysR family regulator